MIRAPGTARSAAAAARSHVSAKSDGPNAVPCAVPRPLGGTMRVPATAYSRASSVSITNLTNSAGSPAALSAARTAVCATLSNALLASSDATTMPRSTHPWITAAALRAPSFRCAAECSAASCSLCPHLIITARSIKRSSASPHAIALAFLLPLAFVLTSTASRARASALGVSLSRWGISSASTPRICGLSRTIWRSRSIVNPEGPGAHRGLPLRNASASALPHAALSSPSITLGAASQGCR